MIWSLLCSQGYLYNGHYDLDLWPLRPKKELMSAYCHMLKKKLESVDWKYFFLILFFITELMLDDIKNAFLHLKSDI